jgi:undecaprenyl-diphosphatase
MRGSVISALLLGLLFGISEALPISSAGHVALAGMLFGIKNAGPTLAVFLQLGSVLASAVVLRQRLGLAMSDGARALASPVRFRTSSGGQDALFIILTLVPSLIIGFVLRDHVKEWMDSPLVVGLGFFTTAALLVSARFARQGVIEHPGIHAALLLGVVQGIAVVPGLSRSGLTIAVALYLGVARSRAFELSMLMSIPAGLGAVLIELPQLVGTTQLVDTMSEVPAALLGAAVACISGLFALLALRKVVVGGMFPLFALWVFPIAIATLFMARAWPK